MEYEKIYILCWLHFSLEEEGWEKNYKMYLLTMHEHVLL